MGKGGKLLLGALFTAVIAVVAVAVARRIPIIKEQL